MTEVVKIILIGLVVMLTSCTSPNNRVDKYKDTLLIANWAADAAGCSNFRSQEIAEKLVADNHLMHRSKKEFLEVFHLPNDTYSISSATTLKYYVGCLCQNNKQIPNSDRCWVLFEFKSNKLVDMDFVCQ